LGLAKVSVTSATKNYQIRMNKKHQTISVQLGNLTFARSHN